MDLSELAQNGMKFQWKIAHLAHDRTMAKVIMHVAAFIAVASAGFVVGGGAGAATAVVWWTAVLIVRRWLRAMNDPPLSGPPGHPQSSAYAGIEDVNDCLEDIARRRNWDLDKRFDIARMACENRTTTFDELERRYDRGVRSAYAQLRQHTSREPKNDDSS